LNDENEIVNNKTAFMSKPELMKVYEMVFSSPGMSEAVRLGLQNLFELIFHCCAKNKLAIGLKI
jgi:molybdopterin biosynthesis enzyme MoaB